MHKRRPLIAASVSLAGSLLLGSAAPSVAPPGESISLVGLSEHRNSSGYDNFRVKASTVGILYPGVTRKISVTIVNPNPFPIAVRTINGRFASTSRRGCQPTATNLLVRPYSGRLPLVVPAFSRRAANQLEIHMPNSVVDACQHAQFVIDIDSDAVRADR